MKWTKKNDCLSSIKEVIMKNTGLTESELLSPIEDLEVTNLMEAACAIKKALVENIPIVIFGDYDADGVTSSAILQRTLYGMGFLDGQFRVLLPRRFTEGYGLNERSVQRLISACDSFKKPCLVITIDNGISSAEVIKMVKDKGHDILVLDHHLRRDDGILPDAAGVIVDPHIYPGTFNDYCAAGLAFKLAKLLIADNKVIDLLSTLAAIGTVADVMPLISENRSIVRRGLANINHGQCPLGIIKLLEQLGLYDIDESNIGFTIGPILNAAGRLSDEGAFDAFLLLTTADADEAKALAQFLIENNDVRKALVEENMEMAELAISNGCMYGEAPLVVYTTKEAPRLFHEGIVGIIAGRLAEKYKVPAIVLTENDDGILKGSGRSYGTLNLKELLDSVSGTLLGFGGHAGAAGLSLKPQDVESFKDAAARKLSEMPDYSIPDTDEEFYDLDLKASQVVETAQELKKYGPFGEGNPKPVFCISDIILRPRGGKFYSLMGNNHQHVKLYGGGFDIVAFGMSELYEEMGFPMHVQALGTITENRFGGNTSIQLEVTDMKAANSVIEPTSLAGRLAEELKKHGY